MLTTESCEASLGSTSSSYLPRTFAFENCPLNDCVEKDQDARLLVPTLAFPLASATHGQRSAISTFPSVVAGY